MGWSWFNQKAQGSLDTIKQISKEYADEPNISFTIIAKSDVKRMRDRLKFYEEELILYRDKIGILYKGRFPNPPNVQIPKNIFDYRDKY